jgi:hypothetical protein
MECRLNPLTAKVVEQIKRSGCWQAAGMATIVGVSAMLGKQKTEH